MLTKLFTLYSTLFLPLPYDPPNLRTGFCFHSGNVDASLDIKPGESVELHCTRDNRLEIR